MGNSPKDDSPNDGDTSSGGGGDGEAPPAKSSLFSEGEKVLAYHGPRIYEAKVQKVELRKKEWKYFVHYLGWSKTWDEWVGADRLMKHTEENVLKQQALDKKLGVDKNSKSGRSAQTKPKSSADVKVEKEDPKNNVTKGKKRKNDSGTEDSLLLEKLDKGVATSDKKEDEYQDELDAEVAREGIPKGTDHDPTAHPNPPHGSAQDLGASSHAPEYQHFTFTETHYNLMQAQLGTLSESMDGFRCNYENMREDVGMLRSDYRSLREEVGTLNARFDSFDQHMASLTSTVNNMSFNQQAFFENISRRLPPPPPLPSK